MPESRDSKKSPAEVLAESILDTSKSYWTALAAAPPATTSTTTPATTTPPASNPGIGLELQQYMPLILAGGVGLILMMGLRR